MKKEFYNVEGIEIEVEHTDGTAGLSKKKKLM